MENQMNVENQNPQQIGQNPVSQPAITPEKPKTNYLLIGGVILACFIVFGFGGFLVGKQFSVSSPSNNVPNEQSIISPNPESSATPNPTSDIENSTSNWKTFTTKDQKFTIKYPNDWVLSDQSEEVDLYNDGNIQLAHDISISKNSHIFISRNPLAWGPGVCLFPDSPPFKGPSQEFKDYVEVKAPNFVFRRPKITQPTPANNLRWTICSKEPTSPGNYTDVAGFGTAWYETPVNYDPMLLQEMDQIFSSFVANN